MIVPPASDRFSYRVDVFSDGEYVLSKGFTDFDAPFEFFGDVAEKKSIFLSVAKMDEIRELISLIYKKDNKKQSLYMTDSYEHFLKIDDKVFRFFFWSRRNSEFEKLIGIIFNESPFEIVLEGFA